MELTDLNPSFVRAGGEGVRNVETGLPVPERQGVGLAFDCPCGCGTRCFIHFANPIDGGESIATHIPAWRRTGETFENLTLSPSIHRVDPDGCGWHGFIRNGKIETV